MEDGLHAGDLGGDDGQPLLRALALGRARDELTQSLDGGERVLELVRDLRTDGLEATELRDRLGDPLFAEVRHRITGAVRQRGQLADHEVQHEQVPDHPDDRDDRVVVRRQRRADDGARQHGHAEDHQAVREGGPARDGVGPEEQQRHDGRENECREEWREDAAGERGGADDEQLRDDSHVDECGLDPTGLADRPNDQLVRQREHHVQGSDHADAPARIPGVDEQPDHGELDEHPEANGQPRGLARLLEKELIPMIAPHGITTCRAGDEIRGHGSRRCHRRARAHVGLHSCDPMRQL